MMTQALMLIIKTTVATVIPYKNNTVTQEGLMQFKIISKKATNS